MQDNGVAVMFDQLVLPEGFSLRAAEAHDEAFMVALFASANQHLQMMHLLEEDYERLLLQQYRLQQHSWQANWPAAVTFVVVRLSRPIGKVIFHLEAGALHIIDIVLAADDRGKGYGTAILNAVLRWADQNEAQLQLSVGANNNRAKNLYLSLGFQVAEVGNFYLRLIRQPECSEE